VGEAAGSEAVEGGGVELGTDAAAPDVGVEVERVEIAEGGVCAVVGDERRPGRGEADDGVSDGRDDDAGVRRAGGERVRPELFPVVDGQACEDVVGKETSETP